MSIDFAIEVIRRSMLLALMVAGPLLLASLIIGVVVSMVQAVTQIQEQTLTFIPKILAIGVVFLLSLPWILNRLIAYFVGAVSSLGTMAS